MKKVKVLFMGIAFACSFVYFCYADDSVKEPELAFVQDTFDFGEAGEGSIVSHDYLFTNTGSALLVIEEVRPTCGCTVADNFDRQVAPGAKGKISLSFRTQGYNGRVTKSIVVRTNILKQPEVFLTLQGSVKALISVEPKNLLLGNIDDAKVSPLQGTYTVTNTSDIPLKITEVVTPGPLTTAVVTTVKEGFEYRIDVTVKPPYKERQNTEWITLKTNSAKMPELSLMYTYTATPAAKVYPIAIMLSNEGLAKGTDQVVSIDCREGFSMSVVDLKSSDPKLTFVLKEVEKGRAYKLTIHIPAGYVLNDKVMPTISFKLKDIPNEPSYSIPIYKM